MTKFSNKKFQDPKPMWTNKRMIEACFARIGNLEQAINYVATQNHIHSLAMTEMAKHIQDFDLDTYLAQVTKEFNESDATSQDVENEATNPEGDA